MSEGFEVRSLFRTYAVEFTDNAVAAVREALDPECTFVVCDERVAALWADRLRPLTAGPRAFLLSPTEHTKTLAGVQRLIEGMVAAAVRRDHTVVAIGGGITQDVAAFAASILYRGVDWVFVPTTLLAQSDSCVGSKTSINLGETKNLVGNFAPPARVLLDLSFLDSLPEGDVRSGVGEMLHFYLYAGSPLAAELVADLPGALNDRGRLRRFVAESLRIKRGVVEVDEFDRGERHKFNYGHTFGHALESLTDYAIPHGQAVTVGMDVANYISQRLGLMAPGTYADLHALLAANFPTRRWDDAASLDSYCRFLMRDKKNLGGNVGCILAEGPGRLVPRQLPLDEAFRGILADYFAGPHWRS